MKVPKKLNFGFGDLFEVAYLETVLGVSRQSAMRILRSLRIEPLYFGKEAYFSIITLQRILFVLSRPGARGLVAPGSAKKYDPRTAKNPKYLFEVTDGILEQAAKPEILSEMAACDGRYPDILKKFVTPPPGRPPQKKKGKE